MQKKTNKQKTKNMAYNYGYSAPEVSNTDIKMCLASKDPLGTANADVSYLLLQQCCKDSGGQFFQSAGGGVNGWKCYKRFQKSDYGDGTTIYSGGYTLGHPKDSGGYTPDRQYGGGVPDIKITTDPIFNDGGYHPYSPKIPIVDTNTTIPNTTIPIVDTNTIPNTSIPIVDIFASIPIVDTNTTDTTTTTFSLDNLTKHDKNTYIIAGALILGAFLLID
jgi:hypothetical protein